MSTPHLRLAILDCPKQLINSDEAMEMLSQMVREKQRNFERTSASLVITDKHDMIGTHFLIYDTTQLLRPRAVAAIRCTYEERAREHNIPLPIDTYFSALSPEAQAAVTAYRKRKGLIVDCNAWFVNPTYSKNNSNLNLSEILFFAVALFILRMDKDHFLGATNERYKASQWVKRVGYFPDGLEFKHPYFPYTHKLTLVESFYPNWLRQCWDTYQNVVMDRFELVPDSVKLKTVNEVVDHFAKIPNLRVA